MSVPTNGHLGSASGWSVYQHGTQWQWSAYGPRGGNVGMAATEAEAEAKARRAERSLCRPMGLEGK